MAAVEEITLEYAYQPPAVIRQYTIQVTDATSSSARQTALQSVASELSDVTGAEAGTVTLLTVSLQCPNTLAHTYAVSGVSAAPLAGRNHFCCNRC